MEKYESIDEALNISDAEIVPSKKPILRKDEVLKINEIDKDYDYTRGNLYSLIEKGQEAINGIMEVAGQLIKSVADSTDKLMDLQKKIKEVDEENVKTTNNVTNNALFVGSTSDLSKMLKQQFLNNTDNTDKNEKV